MQRSAILRRATPPTLAVLPPGQRQSQERRRHTQRQRRATLFTLYRMLRAAFAAILVLATVADSRAQSLDAFLIQLRRAVQAGDRAAVAGMIRFPITISMVGLRVPFKDAPALLERYDDIFTTALRESIARGEDVT